MPIIRPIAANHTEVVEIAWRLADGTIHYERHTCPPRATITARRREIANLREHPEDGHGESPK